MQIEDARCQPPQTRVLVPDASYRRGGNGPGTPTTFRTVPIEDLRVGDLVVSYGMGGALRPVGSAVTSVGSAPFTGRLIVAATDRGHLSRYTPAHRCIVKPDGAFADRWVVYLMRRGQSFRVGMTAGRTRIGDGVRFTCRMREQGGDAMWVLSTHEGKADALAAELYASWRFGVPQASFQVQSEKDLRGQSGLDSFWMKVGDLTRAAESCLNAYGRVSAYPIVEAGGPNFLARRTTEVRACNVLDGMEMLDVNLLRCKGSAMQDALLPVRVSSEFYEGPVWSVEVAHHHTYVADGLVTRDAAASARGLITAEG